MKLKTIDVQVDGKTVTLAVLDSAGLPVYVHEDGKEIGFDAPSTVSKVTALNGEAMRHRQEKEAAEAALKAFDGIEDADAARTALETVKSLASGDIKTAAQIKEITEAAKRAAEEQVAAAVKAKDEEIKKISDERDAVTSAFHGELIGGGFNRSKFISEKIAVPVDLMQAQFGRNFKVEDNRLVAYDAAGKKIYSRASPGNLAEFDEALEELVSSYPHRDQILKGQMGSGGGAGNGNGGQSGKATMSRSQFDALSPADKAAKAGEMRAGKLTLTDA